MRGDPGCVLCKLHKTTENVCTLGDGPQRADVMIIKDAPGTSTRLIDKLLDEHDIVAFYAHAVSCKPPEDKTAGKREIAACKKWLDHQIAQVKPKFVLLVGNVPLLAITGEGGINKKRGTPFEKDGIIYLATFSYDYLLRKPEKQYVVEKDLRLFKEIIDGGKIPREEGLNYHIVRDAASFRRLLADLRGVVSIDTEATCLYPWQTHNDKGEAWPAKITSLGFGTATAQWILPISATAWKVPFSPEVIETMIEQIEETLREHKVKLVAHNGKFDFLWLWVQYGVQWYDLFDFDTMLAHYILDENSFHGLDILARKYLGAHEYDVPLELKWATKGTLEDHALYLAHDVYYTRKLRFILGRKLRRDRAVKRVFDEIMMPCARLFVEVEYDGVCINMAKFADAEKYLRTEAARAEKEMMSAIREATGTDKWKDINWGSPKQVGELLFGPKRTGGLGIAVVERTAKGAASTSESVLKRIDHPVAGELIKFRGAKQQLSFFIEGWKPFLHQIKSQCFLHPSFKLHGTVTGRLSCLSGDTPIMAPGGTTQIQDVKRGDLVYCYDKNKRLTLGKVSWSGKTGIRPVYRVQWSSGKAKGVIVGTGDHRVRLASGKYTRIDKLKRGDSVMALRRKERSNYPELRIFGDTAKHQGWRDEHRVLFYITHGYWAEHVHHKDDDPHNNKLSNLEGMTRSKHMAHHQTPEEARRRALLAHSRHGDKIVKATIVARKKWSAEFLSRETALEVWEKFKGKKHAAELAAKSLGVSRKAFTARLADEEIGGYSKRNNHKILSVEKLPGLHEVYDITVEDHHNFIANEVCVHNCVNPNLQQVPRDERIRSLITAPDGWTLVECDLSQIELRVAAELAQERHMLAAFIAGHDLHWLTCLRELERGGGKKDLVISTAQTWSKKKNVQYADAIEILRDMGAGAAEAIDKSWKELRKKAKAVSFGYLYGMWWKKFKIYARDSYDVILTDEEAEDSRKFFFDVYSDLPRWHKRQREFARRNGYVRTLSGRKRRLPAARSMEDTPERREAERQAINSPVQSFANEINLMAAIQLRREFTRNTVRICGTVHDAILMWVKNEHVVPVTSRLLEIMTRPALFDKFEIELGVPVLAESKIGPWSQGISLERWKERHGNQRQTSKVRLLRKGAAERADVHTSRTRSSSTVSRVEVGQRTGQRN